MPVSRAGWEEQNGGKKMSSFEKSKRDRAKAVSENANRKATMAKYADKKSETSSPAKKAPPVGAGMIKKAIGQILNKNSDTKRRIKEEAGM